MTQKEIRKFLDNTKVYVNGNSREIQEKLFSFGYKWSHNSSTKVSNTGKPFLFIYKKDDITCSSDMDYFTEHQNREITAEEILSLEITEPSYRPFKSQEECWNEMQKHHPFGWICHKLYGGYSILKLNISDKTEFEELFTYYTFADGTPFGILEK